MRMIDKKGTALVLVLLVISILLLSGTALMTKVIASARMMGTDLHKVKALYIAEAGIERARWRLGLQVDLSSVPPANDLYTDEPYAGGKYTVVLSERTIDESTIISSGTYASITRMISVRIRAGGGWWDGAWGYCRQITITNNTASDLTAYQVKVPVPFDASKMNADASDLRFLDASETELPCWIEAVEAGFVIAWVNVPLLPGGAQISLFVYYGNSSATPVSDFAATMEPEYIKYDIASVWTSRVSTASIASGDDVGAWINLPFAFPYYHGAETNCYACSNGYVSFGNDYGNDERNRTNRLRQRRIIAAFWDDLRTDTIYGVCDEPGIYVDSYPDRLMIDYEAYQPASFFFNAAALFQVTLHRCGDLLLSRGSATNDWLFSETLGISRGAGGVYIEITSESQPNRSWLFAMRKYVEPEPSVEIGAEETGSPTVIIYWKEE